MSSRKNILIVCTHNYNQQPRVLRTIEALKNNYNISVAGLSDAKEHAINFIPLTQNPTQGKKEYWHFNKPAVIRLPVSFYHKYFIQKQFNKAANFEQQYWTNERKSDLIKLSEEKIDLIISHGVDTLPLAVKISNNKIPVIFNAHEYYPLEFEQNENWLKTQGAFANYAIGKYLPKCTRMFCVSEQIQLEYQKSNKINSIVITNATSYKNLNPKKTSLPIKIIHHGAAMRARQIELMADMMNYLSNDYELYLMLVPTEVDYLSELKLKYKSNSKIIFIEPVAVSEIPAECNKYDIGLFILPPVNFNWLNVLPNKLFEYVQGRLCLAVSPNPDMKGIVEKFELGIVSENYSAGAMAEKIKSLNIVKIDAFKSNSHKHAAELSGEHNQRLMLSEINKILLN